MASAKPRPARGATLNRESGRFNLPAREADGDWLDAREMLDGAPPKPRTTVTVEHPRTIISRNQSPDVPFDRSINPYRGCDQPRNGYARPATSLTLLHADQIFDEDSTGAIAEVFLGSLASTHAAIESDSEITPYGFGLLPASHSPSLNVKFLAALAETVDGCTFLDSDCCSAISSATLESAIFEIGEPIAHQELALAIAHALVGKAALSLRHGRRSKKCDQQRHHTSLSLLTGNATASTW